MQVALIGLGDIARKAYLPVLAATAGIELHLVTRNEATLGELGDRYRIRSRHTDLASALERPLDAAFVHAATGAHEPLAAQLLDRGISTFVDKPLAYDLAACERLVALAEARGCSLMVGFNRRFAPLYAELKDRPRELIIMQKNRARLPGDPRQVVFDDFVHVVDTLRALAPGEVKECVTDARMVGGELHHVALTLRGSGFSAFGVMNRMSGADEESLEVMGGGSKRRVENIGVVTDFEGAGRQIVRRPDWAPVTSVRGFERMCSHFLGAVERGERLCARDALATHALCEMIVSDVGRLAGP